MTRKKDALSEKSASFYKVLYFCFELVHKESEQPVKKYKNKNSANKSAT